MFINYEMATIEITKAEAKEAGVFKSEMYENLKEAREATGYKVVVKDTKRKADTAFLTLPVSHLTMNTSFQKETQLVYSWKM